MTVNLTKRMTRWYANAGVTYLRSTERSAAALRMHEHSAAECPGVQHLGRNPNDFVNLDGRLVGDVGWQGKFQAVVRLPSGFRRRRVSMPARARTGIRYGRFPSSIAGQSPPHPAAASRRSRTVFIRSPSSMPGCRRIPLGRGARLGVFLDALNLNNENSPQAVVQRNVTSSSYQFPTTFVPRAGSC